MPIVHSILSHLDGQCHLAEHVAMRAFPRCRRPGFCCDRALLVSAAAMVTALPKSSEFARAFESFPGDADRLFPGWRGKLGV